MSSELPAIVIEHLDLAVLVLDRALARVVFANGAARELLHAFGGDGGPVPGELRHVLGTSDAALTGARFRAAGTITSPRGERFVVRTKRLPSLQDSLLLVVLTAFIVRDRDLREALRERYGLTVRDQEIVLSVRAGMTNAQIAARTGLSEGTVKQYLSRIFETFAVSNRTQLVAALRSSGDEETVLPSPARSSRPR